MSTNPSITRTGAHTNFPIPGVRTNPPITRTGAHTNPPGVSTNPRRVQLLTPFWFLSHLSGMLSGMFTSIDSMVARIATAQHGLVTVRDALAAGLSTYQIEVRVRSGRWEPITRGVYRIAGAPETWMQLAKAATLAAPPGAVASHLTAAALIGLDTPPPSIPHITVPYGRSARLPMARVHRARLPEVCSTVRFSIPVTKASRTLADCSLIIGPKRLGALVDDAMHLRLVTARSVEEAIESARRRPRRRREGLLLDLLEPWRSVIKPGSPAEVRLFRVVESWGYPRPTGQIPVTDEEGRTVGRIDAGWEAYRIGLEYDSKRWHGPGAWEHDEARHRLIERLGWKLLHADATDLLPGERSLRQRLADIWPDRAVA